jgi:NAD dependent epimerase/dehydratase family enzyme
MEQIWATGHPNWKMWMSSLISRAKASIAATLRQIAGQFKESRIQTTDLLGQAIGQSVHPPRLWMNASTATIYRHSLDRAMDEQTGEIGGKEANAPAKWRFSIDVATSWESAFFPLRHPKLAKSPCAAP